MITLTQSVELVSKGAHWARLVKHYVPEQLRFPYYIYWLKHGPAFSLDISNFVKNDNQANIRSWAVGSHICIFNEIQFPSYSYINANYIIKLKLLNFITKAIIHK